MTKSHTSGTLCACWPGSKGLSVIIATVCTHGYSKYGLEQLSELEQTKAHLIMSRRARRGRCMRRKRRMAKRREQQHGRGGTRKEVQEKDQNGSDKMLKMAFQQSPCQ